MKKTRLLIIFVFSLASCEKFPGPLPTKQPSPATENLSANADTIPDNAAFRLKLVKDSVNADETMFIFRRTATTEFSSDDAAYFPGFSQVSLASISSEGQDLSINCRPYVPGAPIGLDVHTKADGMLMLKTSYEHQMPVAIQIWLVDTYLKDSIDVRRQQYNFTVNKSSPGSIGNKRFKLILRRNTQQQTAQPN